MFKVFEIHINFKGVTGLRVYRQLQLKIYPQINTIE